MPGDSEKTTTPDVSDVGIPLDKDQFSKDEVARLIVERNKGLEANRNEALAEAKKLRERMKSLEGIDPIEVQELRAERAKAQEEREKAEREKAEAAGNWKSVQEQIEKKHAAELAKVVAEKDTVLNHLQRTLVDNAVILELAKHSDTPNLLLPHIKPMMKVMLEDGEYVARIVDKHGNVRIGKGKGTEPMTLPELMEELKQDKDYAPAFRGSGSSGGGAPKSRTSGAGSKTIAVDDGQAFLRDLKGISDGTVKIQRQPT